MADIANDVKCTTCDHLASMHNDTADGENTGSCTAQNCDCAAMATGSTAAMVAGAVAQHSTDTSDATWDGPANEKQLGDSPTEAQLKAAYAWVPDAADDLSKSNCKFIHHEVGSDGNVGAANTTACSTGIGVLNGGRGGTTIPDADVQGVYNHFHKHLVDSGRDPDEIPALEAGTQTEALQVTSEAASGASAAQGSDELLTAITAAQSAVAAVSNPPTWVEQVSGLLDAAGAAAAGLSDDDAERWAQATDAAIDAALDLCTEAGDSLPDDVSAVIESIKQLDAAMDAYLKAQNIDDPDESDSGAGEGDAMTAAGEGTDQLTPWTIPVLVVEGTPTGDGRFIRAGSLAACDLPATLMALDENGDFHDGAFPVGRIDTMERYDASALINPKTGEAYGEGVFAWKSTGVMTSADIATQIITLVREQVLTGVSADLRDTESVLELLNDDGTVEEGVDPMDLDEDAFWDALDAGKIQETVTAGRIMGATVCPFPAFEGAYIEIGDVATPVAASGGARVSLRFHDVYGLRHCAACEEGSMVAAAAPMEPPADWFGDPQFAGLTPLTIQEDGRVYGHMAAWGTCHTGVSGRCVTPPRNKSDYAYFRTGAVRTDDGELVRVGQLTLGTGHASLQADARTAIEHYDHTGSAVADVATGEDRFGIWVAGALRPDVSELQIRQLRAAAISGDWRNIGGRLEMVGALAVNVPGFPVVQARVASGAEQSLVAAGGRAVITAHHRVLQDLIAFKQMAESEILESRADRLRRSVHVQQS